MRKHLEEAKASYEGGATRSVSETAYHLMPAIADFREAKRWHLGAIKHNPGNWKKGGVAFIVATFGHLDSHINDLKLNMHPEDDHLAAIRWASSALMWFQENKPKEFKKALLEFR